MSNYTVRNWDEIEKITVEYLHAHILSLDQLLELPEIRKIVIDWHHLDDWEVLDDREIYAHLQNLKEPSGKLLLITEVSYKENMGPFEVEASELDRFIDAHLKEFGECFFNGDVMIFSRSHKIAWLFHHEGVYSFIEFE